MKKGHQLSSNSVGFVLLCFQQLGFFFVDFLTWIPETSFCIGSDKHAQSRFTDREKHCLGREGGREGGQIRTTEGEDTGGGSALGDEGPLVQKHRLMFNIFFSTEVSHTGAHLFNRTQIKHNFHFLLRIDFLSNLLSGID